MKVQLLTLLTFALVKSSHSRNRPFSLQWKGNFKTHPLDSCIGKKRFSQEADSFLFNENGASKLIHETRSFFCSMKIELQLALELVKKGSFKKQTLFLFNEHKPSKLILLNFALVKKCDSRNQLFFTSMKIELQDSSFQILYH